MNTCRICQSEFTPFLHFGNMPIANGFLTPDQFKDEYFFELKVGFCASCGMVQLTEQPDPEQMFHQNYAFYSSTSNRMARHFRHFADLVKQEIMKGSDPLVVEIGCNDGIMLQHFTSPGMRHLGIEPSANVARVAQEKGIHTVSAFFDQKLAEELALEHGQADVILAANVMCHIPDLHTVFAGIRSLLKPDGRFLFEDPYLGDIVNKTSYDQIYDEHAFYFSLGSIRYMVSQYGLEVIDVAPQNVHGGSMRYHIAHKGAYTCSPAVSALAEKEERMQLGNPETFSLFRHKVEQSRDNLHSLLKNLKDEGKQIVGYGATSKSSTVTNYCHIGPDLVDYISDTTPIKQNKFSPGVHIPVKPYEEFQNHYPDCALLFAWNHAEEIFLKESAFKGSGGKWILYVPEVNIIS